MDFLDHLEKALEEAGFNPECPKCGCDDVVMDDNGDYEFYFCTQCDWESKPGEYGLKVYEDED